MRARLVATLLICSGVAVACFQVDNSVYVLQSRYIAGKVTLDGKPIAGAKLSLREVIPSTTKFVVDPARTAIATATSDKQGAFAFGKIPSGKYLLVMTSPSYETTRIELKDSNEGVYQKVALVFTKDFCKTVTIYTD